MNMASTIVGLQELYKQAKYQEVKNLVEKEKLDLNSPADAQKLLIYAWSCHQLGDYEESMSTMVGLNMGYAPDSEIGESARRGLAHGILQAYGDIQRADKVLQEIPPSLARDNVRINLILTAVRQGKEVPVDEIFYMIFNAAKQVPYETVNGHVINNGTLALYEARERKDVGPYLPVLPGLIEIAIGIYEALDVSKNHLAGALYRGSLIFEAAGPAWIEGAEEMIRNSIKLWQELVASQGGERYRKNLEGALSQLERLQNLRLKEL